MSTRKAASPGGQSPAALPPLTVARFEQATLLMERLVDENTDVFVGRMHAYRERQRAATSRKLTPDEAASVAAGLAASLSDDADLVGVAEDVQAGGLRAVDEPGAHEVLLAAGVATAPAFLNAALRLVALIELPADTFEAAYEDDTLDDAIAAHVSTLRALDLDEARARAVSALDYLSVKAGAGSGEGLRLLARVVWQALNQAAEQMTPMIASGLSSLTDSQPPTDGPVSTSSTEFAGSAL